MRHATRTLNANEVFQLININRFDEIAMMNMQMVNVENFQTTLPEL